MYPSNSFMPYFSTSLSSLRCHLLTSSVTQTFLFTCKYIGGGGLVAKSYLALVTPWTVSCQALCPWDSLGQNTGVGCHFLLQGIFPTQESNPNIYIRTHLHFLSSRDVVHFDSCLRLAQYLNPECHLFMLSVWGFVFFLVVGVSLFFCCFNKHGLFKKIYLAVPGLSCGTWALSWGL